MILNVDIFIWLVVWNIFYFSIIYGNKNPNWLICFKMVKTTNQLSIAPPHVDAENTLDT